MFGTDGIRGYPNQEPLTAEGILQLAYALAAFLNREEELATRPLVIGRDTRQSGTMFEAALVAGLTGAGRDVILGGVLPTPAVSHLCRHYHAALGIVLSASHNPADYNGIKLFDEKGEKLPLAWEKEIEALFHENPDVKVGARDIGKEIHPDPAPRSIYEDLLVEKFSPLDLQGLRVVLDCAQGACYQIAPSLFSRLGAEVFAYYNEPDGTNINLACGALYPDVAAAHLEERGADLAFSFDGDGDRVLIIDESGEIRDGDYILYILGQSYLKRDMLPQNKVVATSMSNIGLQLALEEIGGELLRTKVGDRHVYEEMKKEGLGLGGEQSGHIILTSYGTTGDGLATALEIARVVRQEEKALSELAGEMKKYPQILESVAVPSKPPFQSVPGLSEAQVEVEEELEGSGRLVLRYSGTEPVLRIMLEGPEQRELERLKDRLASAIKEGFEKLS